MTPFAYWLFARLCRYVLLPLYAHTRVSGVENVPLSGPLVVCANHLNDGDPFILSACIPRRLVFLAKAELFRAPAVGFFARLLGAIPVQRHEADLSALRLANDALKQGLALGVFPEGRTSTRDARLSEAWPGAALVALRDGAPVLPVAITGSQALQYPFFLPLPWRRADVTVTIGEPLRLPRPTRLNAAAAREATDTIMHAIAALLPVEYRGYYGDSESHSAPASERSDE